MVYFVLQQSLAVLCAGYVTQPRHQSSTWAPGELLAATGHPASQGQEVQASLQIHSSLSVLISLSSLFKKNPKQHKNKNLEVFCGVLWITFRA